jgi:hypothetical protein
MTQHMNIKQCKQTKDVFRACVNELILLENLNHVHVQKCTRRARKYKILYKVYKEVICCESKQHSSTSLMISDNNKQILGVPITL